MVMLRRIRTKDFIKAGLCLLALSFAWVGPVAAQSPAGSFLHFETGHVKPLALSPDGTRLFAVNTPDGRLAIYDVTPEGLELYAEVPVGMVPISVAARTNTEAWVVNALSDSVSIVEVDPTNPEASRVSRTLHTCDEPRQVVFAGPSFDRAFVSAARRGQSCSVPFDHATESIGRGIVQVFDVNNLGADLGGTPLTTIVLFGDALRGMAASPDGNTVYAAVFHSGNRTTTISEPVVSAGMGLPPPVPGSLPNGPPTGLIVKFNGISWVDELGRDWSDDVGFSLPDFDVFPIDASLPIPAAIAGQEVTGVGTTILGLEVHPSNGKVYASNTEDRNHIRFEGHTFDGTWGLRGSVQESSITIIDGSSPVRNHLNPHINYSGPPASERDRTKQRLPHGHGVFS